jgi:hypothetical protein
MDLYQHKVLDGQIPGLDRLWQRCMDRYQDVAALQQRECVEQQSTLKHYASSK